MTSTTTYKAVIAILAIALAISASTAGYFALRALIQQSSTASKPNPVLSTGSLRVPYNSISYLPFSIETAPATLNITFSITDYNSYYPQSVALYLLTQNQYNTFQSGDHTSSTWYYPYSSSLSTQLTIPSSGNWYLAFNEQDPNGGFPATVSYTLRLANLQDMFL
jgi:hypothetical protein